MFEMTQYNVHNLKEEKRDVPTSYKSWLDYWEKATGEIDPLCKRVDCINPDLAYATDGSHVQLDDPNGDEWWITPLCHKCNTQFGEHFTVYGPLVSATNPKKVLE